MKIKTTDLIGPALDWAVAQCEGAVNYVYLPSTDWSQGGPIIDREITTLERDGFGWFARSTSGYTAIGPTPLIAAMRCYVASKFGDEIEIPSSFN